jgi:hypothetical protein
MLILLLVCSLFHGFYGDTGQDPASIELRAVSVCGDQDSRRSISRIVQSCLSTIFLCTWVTLHPNIAFRPEKPNVGWRERWIWDPLHHFWTYQLSLFIWALLVPECIFLWSMRQFIAAGEIQKKGKCFLFCAKYGSLNTALVPGWTRTHGFFMLMGGFHLFRLPADTPSVPLAHIPFRQSEFVTPLEQSSREQEVPVCPLQIDDIPVAILEILSPTEIEIEDRGKSDWLTKSIVLVQALWFITQCIARRIQHLPLTELEVVTLAYATLNFLIYVFWWNKPQNVRCPIRVYKTATAEHKMGRKEVEAWKTGGVTGLFEKAFLYLVGGQDRYVDYSQESSIPKFWAGQQDSHIGVLVLASVGTSLSAVGFGVIHFIAWYSEFPSRAELILWRASCILLTAGPLIPLLVLIIARISNSPVLVVVAAIFQLVSLPFILLYLPGRAVTLLIAFTTLRSLPDAALIDVDWTTFIPHI